MLALGEDRIPAQGLNFCIFYYNGSRLPIRMCGYNYVVGCNLSVYGGVSKKKVLSIKVFEYLIRHDVKRKIFGPTSTLILAPIRPCFAYTPKNIDLKPLHRHQSSFFYPEKADPL